MDGGREINWPKFENWQTRSMSNIGQIFDHLSIFMAAVASKFIFQVRQLNTARMSASWHRPSCIWKLFIVAVLMFMLKKCTCEVDQRTCVVMQLAEPIFGSGHNITGDNITFSCQTPPDIQFLSRQLPHIIWNSQKKRIFLQCVQ